MGRPQPASQTISSGSAVVFTASVSGIPTPTLNWHRNGTAISGASQNPLVLTKASAAQAGTYTCVATNSIGSVTSNPAILTISSTNDFGRLINLSILTNLSAAESYFTLGVTLGGENTIGTKPLLIRAAGPALRAFGLADVLPDPRLELLSGSAVIERNDNWAGSDNLKKAFTTVGAFNYGEPSSKDAAVYKSDTALGGYTIRVGDTNGGAGSVIAEIYDATSADNFVASTPRLINLAVLKQLSADAILTTGFVIGGSTAKTMLIRAIGPGLTALGVPGVMANPKLELFSGSAVIARNDNWEGLPQLTTVGNSVGAFAITNASSNDAILLITLAPGSYTAQLSGVNGSTGLALLEVYEVP
jgi:Immunoglobulin domain